MNEPGNQQCAKHTHPLHLLTLPHFIIHDFQVQQATCCPEAGVRWVGLPWLCLSRRSQYHWSNYHFRLHFCLHL